jgi:glycosyltransferase involved in cell wall biosynthesis
MHIGVAGPFCLRTFSGDYCLSDAPPTHSFAPLSHYVNELLSRGHEVHVFTTGDTRSQWVRQQGRLSVTVVPRRRQGTMRNFLANERRALANAMLNSQCEIIHANWTYEYALAAQSAHKPCVITAHDAPFALLPYMRPFSYWFLHACMAIPVVHRCDTLCVISPYLRSYYKRFHRYHKHIYVIPEYIPDTSFHYYREKSFAAPVFAAAANGWGKRKNTAALIHAFSLVRKQLPDARLFLFGHGHGCGENAEDYAKQHGLETGIEFAGNTTNGLLLKRWRDEVDILVHPSLEESFCVAIADAMAMGIPVIAGERSGAVPWLLNHGECGMLVDIRQSTEIARAMIRLSHDHSVAANLRAKARARAVSTFKLDAVADQYLRLYHDSLAQ